MPRAELRLLYAALIVLLEVQWNRGAMESRLTQDDEDLKALELCTNSNTQRLGSVFGNFTRHHKKVSHFLDSYNSSESPLREYVLLFSLFGFDSSNSHKHSLSNLVYTMIADHIKREMRGYYLNSTHSNCLLINLAPINSSSELYQFYAGPYATLLLSGAACSSFGFGLMVATAVVFPKWRRQDINRVWLSMCGANLLHIIPIALYNLWYCGRITVNWMEEELGYTLFWVFSDYMLLAMCCWLMSGAWLAHAQLVTVLPSSGRRRLQTLLLSTVPWVAPLVPACTRALVPSWRPPPCAEFVTMFPLGYKLIILLAVISSVCLYARVIYSLCRGNVCPGPNRSLVATAVLGVMFIFMCGIQYAFTVFVIFYYKRCYGCNAWPYIISGLIVTYSVFMYSILIVFGVKRTRRLWIKVLLCKRFNKNKQSPSKNENSNMTTTNSST